VTIAHRHAPATGEVPERFLSARRALATAMIGFIVPGQD
jgi:hypothetical protein